MCLSSTYSEPKYNSLPFSVLSFFSTNAQADWWPHCTDPAVPCRTVSGLEIWPSQVLQALQVRSGLLTPPDSHEGRHHKDMSDPGREGQEGKYRESPGEGKDSFLWQIKSLLADVLL